MTLNTKLSSINEILNLERLTIPHYQILNEIGIERIDPTATCIYCDPTARKLHQNDKLTIRDLP